ncbi:MAG: SusC/RagA family TonB-linked outer membrane protein [Flavobacteriaceae bacterium]
MKLKLMFAGLFLLVGQLTTAQELVYSGDVSDETGPLPGVNIVIKGTSTGTQTDFDGLFSIKAKEGDVIQISYVGMKSQEYTLGPITDISLIMEGDNQLEEVVIMGYGSKKKSELTGSSVQVDSDQIAQIPVASVDQVLQGKVAGLNISSSSGTPGSVSNIRIRGASSITADNEPLYVIDGVPVTSGNVGGDSASSSLSVLSSLNPNDIASMTVLKDASATSAYGARGANGVIVITTKSGNTGKTKFSFNATSGFSNDALNGPEMLTAEERELLFYESLYNSYGDGQGFDYNQWRKFYESNTASFGTQYLDWNAAGRPEGNWDEAMTNENAVSQEYNFSASGGTEKSNFYASVGYYGQEATVIGADFDRISANLNFTTELTDRITLNTRNMVSDTQQDGIAEQSAYFDSPRTAKYFMSPLVQPYNPDGSINIDEIETQTSLYNPLWTSQEDINHNSFTRFISNNSLDYDIPVEGLSFSTRFNIDYRVNAYDFYGNRHHGSYSADDGGLNGYAYQSVERTTNYTIQNRLNYKFDIQDVHVFDVTFLQEYQSNYSYFLAGSASDFPMDGLHQIDSAGKVEDASSNYNDWAIASYLGMVSYNFDSRFVANATYRREGNSRFPSENRWGNFWSAGAAWNIHNEEFMSDVSFIDQLKLRSSYGVSGNAGIPLNQYQALIDFEGNYQDGSAFYPSDFGNGDLTWETSKSFDAGLDFRMLDRLSGGLSIYQRVSDDLLQEVPLSGTSGYDYQMQNIGTMANKGVEFELNYDLIRSEDFNMSIGGNVAHNKNEVLALATDVNGNEIEITTGTRKVASGHAAWEWYMIKYAGVDTQTGQALYYVNGVDGETTTNIGEAQRAYQGASALPTITAGMNLHMEYKGFFLNAVGSYSGGNMIYEGWASYIHTTDAYGLQYYNTSNDALDRWQQPGDVTNVPAVSAGVDPYTASTRYLHEGDYFRLKDLTVGYDFDSVFANKLHLDGLRIFAKGTNLYTWVKDDDLLYDPEVAATGFVELNTPPAKTYSLGLNVTF